MRILFLGDIVGRPGVALIKRTLPEVIAHEGVDLVIANAENATDGSGLAPKDYKVLRVAGVDLVTMGDHVYRKRDLLPILTEDDRICRPGNFPPGSPGRDWVIAAARNGAMVATFCLLGRTYMRPSECPFRAADRILAELEGKTRSIIVDVHAEATADKYLLGHYLKGRVSAVLGTHTHVPTADEQILPPGTAFITDVGMTGPYDSILGRRIDRVLETAVTFVPTAFDVATGDPRLAGALIDLEQETGRAVRIKRLMLDEMAVAALPARSSN
jgi:2',3'-cyclic-nucleotide 2'-phosphodiesterase